MRPQSNVNVIGSGSAQSRPVIDLVQRGEKACGAEFRSLFRLFLRNWEVDPALEHEIVENFL